MEVGSEIFWLCSDRFVTARHIVREIFVDETLLKINGQDYWLWIAYEPNLNTCLMMHLSRERTIFVCYQFLRQLRNRYGTRKAIYTDGARWYDDACKWLRLKHQIYDTGLKNLMERFVQQIKDRTQNALTIIFHVGKRIVIASMFGIGWNYSYCIYIWVQTEYNSLHS